MTSPLDTPHRRRTLLQLVGAALGTGAIEAAFGARDAESDRSIVIEQHDRCVELVPLSGEAPVEEFYDYRYPTELFDGVSGSNGSSYSSAGTTDLQRDRTSVLVLYDGPEGLSLVVVHGRLDGEDDGGVVSFTLRGMPEDASWTVRDDYYLEDGEPAETNFDRWDGDGDVHQLDWAYRGGRTDGGAVRGLGSEFEVTVEPAFNGAAALAADHDFGPIEAWEALSGDRDSPDRIPLELDRPVTIRTGGCGQQSDGEEATVDGSEESDGEAESSGAADEERRHGNRERKRREHEERHDARGDDDDRRDDDDRWDDDHGRGRGHERGNERGRGHERGKGRGHERGKGRGHDRHD